MVLHFTPYPLTHPREYHQSRPEGHHLAFPHTSRKSSCGAMTPRNISRSPHAIRDIHEGDGHHLGRAEANHTPRHLGRAVSPDKIGVTPALQRAREEARDQALNTRKAPMARPLVTLPSFRESFPQSLSEPTDLTPTCAFNAHHEKYTFKPAQIPGAITTLQPPLVAPHIRIKSHIRKDREVLLHRRPLENLEYGPIRDARSLPPLTDDDTSSMSSSSGLDSIAEANYSPNFRSTAEYRYPPLLPEPSSQQRLGQITPQILHSWDNRSTPPSSSTPNVSESCQSMDNECGPSDCPRRDPPQPSGNDVLKWLEYAEEARDEKGSVYYQCRWEKGGRLPTACDYRAQKQAMKRHIEATHLKYKPHKCSFCHKAYSQKTALEVHEATHTGATPHECLFKCGRAFSDPARRYRHHVEAHGYVPRQTNKKHGNAQMRVVRDKVQYST